MQLKAQYKLVQSSRRALLDYCTTMAADDFVKVDPAFGFGSIRNFLTHVGNTYEWWIGSQALGHYKAFTRYEAIKDAQDVETLFACVDMLMEDFFRRYEQNPLQKIAVRLRENTFESTPLELFTHVVTHEFHHKGQIMTLSRHLGYIPVDADIIR